MSQLETEALSLSLDKPRLYCRYMDDCILVWLHGMAALMKFIEFMNSRHPDINSNTCIECTFNLKVKAMAVTTGGGK